VTNDKELGMTARLKAVSAACGLAFGLAGLLMPAAQAAEVYRATLVPMNGGATHTDVRGEVRITVSGTDATFELHARGLSPSMMHMAHLHGFDGDRNATCPGAAADVNGDGVVDLLETEPSSGVTMIPFSAQPATLKIATDTYPMASKDGAVAYRQKVSLAELSQAMSAQFKGASPDFSRRVIFVHGMPAAAQLPQTAASLPGVPAQVTIPIACGKLVRAG
jgi:hypothetical protein